MTRSLRDRGARAYQKPGRGFPSVPVPRRAVGSRARRRGDADAHNSATSKARHHLGITCSRTVGHGSAATRSRCGCPDADPARDRLRPATVSRQPHRRRTPPPSSARTGMWPIRLRSRPSRGDRAVDDHGAADDVAVDQSPWRTPRAPLRARRARRGWLCRADPIRTRGRRGVTQAIRRRTRPSRDWAHDSARPASTVPGSETPRRPAPPSTSHPASAPPRASASSLKRSAECPRGCRDRPRREPTRRAGRRRRLPGSRR
jgi:hypothetical protein